MTTSHKHQQAGLYTGLVERARKGLPGLSVGAMELAYGFDSKEQVQHALDALVQSGHIQIDIGGRFPSMRLLKDRYKALHNRGRPLFLSSGAPANGSKPAPHSTQEPAAPSLSAVAASCALEAQRPAPAPTAAAAGNHVNCETITFRLPRPDYEWLVDEMEQSGLAIALPAFCIQLLRAEMDRRRTEDAPKHKLTADVLRAAREEGREIGEFVTSMIMVGMQAREMNRRGV